MVRAKTAELCAMSSGSAGQRQPSCVSHVVWFGKVSSLLAEISPRDVEEKIKENKRTKLKSYGFIQSFRCSNRKSKVHLDTDSD